MVRFGIALITLAWAMLQTPAVPILVALLLAYLAFNVLSTMYAVRTRHLRELQLTGGYVDAILIGTTLALHPAIPLLLATPVLMIAGRWAMSRADSRQLTAQYLMSLVIAWSVSHWFLEPAAQALAALYIAVGVLVALRKVENTRAPAPDSHSHEHSNPVAELSAPIKAASQPSEQPFEAEPKTNTEASFQQPERVLYLLGNAADSQSLVEQFSGWNFHVDASSDLAHLVTLAYPGGNRPTRQPVAMVLDLRGRPEDPFEIARLFTRSPALSRLRLILIGKPLTGQHTDELLQSGYHAVLSDPIEKTLLFNALHASDRSTPEQTVTSLFQHYLRTHTSSPPLEILLALPGQLQLKVAKRLLERDGHSVLAVSAGDQALDALAAHRFDAALIHVTLPDMDGYEVAQIHRLTQPQRIGTTLLLITENPSPQVLQRATEVGAQGLLSLPLQPRQLRERLYRQRRSEYLGTGSALADSSSQLKPDLTISLLDHDTLLDLEQLGHNLDFVQELATRFIIDGKQILNELSQALKHRDMETFRDCSHALKGIAGSVGAARLQLFCLNLTALSSQQLLDNQDRLLGRLGNTLEEANDALLKYINQRQEQASQ